MKRGRTFFWIGFVICMALLASRPGQTAEPDNRRVLPGLANTFGANGTRFESEVWIANLGSTAAGVELGLIPFAGTAAPPLQTRLLAAGETLRLRNALLELFGLDGTAGTLTARSDQLFDLRAVTANVANPMGTYGLSLESVAPPGRLVPGQAGHSIWLSHSSDPSRGSRTNITVALTSPNSTVTVSVYDAAGVLRGLQVISSETPVSWQASTAQLAANPNIAIGRVKFAVTAGEATGFTSVVDNITGDGFVVQSERAGTGAADLLLNGVVRTPGVNNTRFVTDVRLFNPNESEQAVTIDALGFPSGPRVLTKTIAANGLLEFADILGPDGFNFPDGVAGALRFRAPLPLLVAGRTNNVDPSGAPGTFSILQRAVAYEAGSIKPAQPATLVGLNQTTSIPGFRSNIAFFAGAAGAAGNLLLCDQFGTDVAASTFALQPHQWLQQPIATWFPGTRIPEDARVDIRLSAGSAHAYAAVVDNHTGDGVVVPPIPLLVVSGAASQLAFTSVPASLVAGAPFNVTVQARRADGSPDSLFAGTVQLEVTSGPGTLQGSSSQAAAAGVASFGNLSLSVPGSYTLTASATGLTAASSTPIEVSEPSSSAIKVGTFASQNGYTTAGTLQILRAEDGSETLQLNSDFRVSSGAGAISIWLARSSGELNSSQSVRLGTLTTRFSGEFSFTIPPPGSAGFTHVITYCDAFRVNFGAAQLRNP